MDWKIFKKERADLIGVISGSKSWQRFAIDDRNYIVLQIAACDAPQRPRRRAAKYALQMETQKLQA
ncbi:hypothetical protein [Agrobacterium vaccinii]|uniref:hypothetical protein n=1 Tax=Agrobacterium vaccinii TaxID=2735528 RepID=UPI001E519980|nr:hypothetical protein [Agrobacterium vaccinii]